MTFRLHCLCQNKKKRKQNKTKKHTIVNLELRAKSLSMLGECYMVLNENETSKQFFEEALSVTRHFTNTIEIQNAHRLTIPLHFRLASLNYILHNFDAVLFIFVVYLFFLYFFVCLLERFACFLMFFTVLFSFSLVLNFRT